MVGFKRVLLLWMLISLLVGTVALAQNSVYHLKLLAVQEEGDHYVGSDADLFLELKKGGSGRVFLETTPLTKLDTQISTRLAKEIACSHFKLDCDQYDFIYTLRAKSSIIGGPSAGASVAALTTIAVLNLKFDPSIAITGTINSGGLVGPVGGVKEKIDAAAQAGLTKVLIPLESSLLTTEKSQIENTVKDTVENDSFNSTSNIDATSVNETQINETQENGTPVNESQIDLIAYGTNHSLEVKEVLDLDAILFELTGKNLSLNGVELSENIEYQKIMQRLQQDLCGRTKQILRELDENKVKLDPEAAIQVNETEARVRNTTEMEDYYSAASFCFGNNVFLKTYYYKQKKASPAILGKFFNILSLKVTGLEQALDEQKIETITQLQTYAIVKERLNDVKEQITEFNEENLSQLAESEESGKEFYYALAYAEERYYSAVSWMEFFSMSGKTFNLDSSIISQFCTQKISEAEDRYQYVNFFIPNEYLVPLQDKISAARSADGRNDSALCIIMASQAKADADAILGSIGLMGNATLDRFIDGKQRAVEKVIAENSQEGMFPILGYSYYQYARSLRYIQPQNSLIYLEYALEMSDLGMYFPEKPELWEKLGNRLNSGDLVLVGEGFLLGAMTVLFIFSLYFYVRKKRKRVSVKK